MGQSALHQEFNDPTALMVRIGELVNVKRQFAVVHSPAGFWTLSYGGPSVGRKREDGTVEVINE